MSAPVFDAASTGTGGFGTSIAWSHTVSGVNRYLKVSASSDFSRVVQTVTFGAQSLTKVLADIANGTSGEYWELVAPAVGTDTITVTLDAAGTLIAGAVSYTGVDQTTPRRGVAVSTKQNFGTSISLAVPSAVDDLVVDCIGGDNLGGGFPAADASQTTRYSAFTSGEYTHASDKPGATSVTMLWTTSGTSTSKVLIGASLQPPITATLGRDEAFSALAMDLGIGVLPTPQTSGFTMADLFQFISKYRAFYDDIAAAGGPAAGQFAFIPCIRRRRR